MSPLPRALQRATLLCFFLPLGLYAATAARTIQGGDAGELGAIAVLGGVPHPPGYPLYVLLAHLSAHLPFGPPFWRVSMTSALCGAAASAVLCRVSWRLTQQLAPSVIAALAFALSPLAWKLAGVPEVFSLHALLCSAVLLLAWRLSEAARAKLQVSAFLLGLACGLGAANHQTIVLMAPLVAWAFAACARRHGPGAFAACAALAGVGVVLGLAPYLLLMVFARQAPAVALVWGRADTWAGLVRHVLRRDYGTFRLASGGAPLDPVRHVRAFAEALPAEYVYLFFAVGLIGVVALFRQRPGFAAALVTSLLLSGFVFLAVFNLPDTPANREVTERFHLMPNLLFAPFIAVGGAAIVTRCRVPLATAVAATALGLGAAIAAGRANWARDTFVERFTLAEVAATEPGAVILGRSDTEGPAMLWVTHVLGVRPDVRYIDVNLATFRWYVERKRRELEPAPTPAPPAPMDAGTYGVELARVMPTYLIPSLSIDAAQRIALEPDGFLTEVVPPGTPVLPLSEVRRRLVSATDVLGPQGPPVDAWSEELRIAAGLKWLLLGADCRRAGLESMAREAAERAATLMPPGWEEESEAPGK